MARATAVIALVCGVFYMSLWGVAQVTVTPPRQPAPPAYPEPAPMSPLDSVILPFPVQHTVPQN